MRGNYVFLSVVLLCLILLFPQIAVMADEGEDKTINEGELKFGFYADRLVAQFVTIVHNRKLNTRIAEIGNRIARVSELPDIQYTFRVVSDPTINAFAAAGGFIYINTGLLDFLESEDELAAVLAHEIGHIVKSHQAKRLRSNQITQFVVRQFVSQINSAVGGLINKAIPPSASSNIFFNLFPQLSLSGFARQIAFDVGGRAGVTLGNAMASSMIQGYAKDQELEADALAVQYTIKAGYDPNALISFFNKLMSLRDRLQLNEKNYVSNLINAKPGLEEREKFATGLISEANKNTPE